MFCLYSHPLGLLCFVPYPENYVLGPEEKINC